MFNDKELIAAIVTNDLKKIKSLINKNNINYQNSEGDSALYVATKYRKLDVIDFLLANGANINIQNNNGNTALYVATKHRNLDAIYFLVANGANINIQNNEGKTALMNVVDNMHLLDVVKFLVANGADINIKDNKDNSALDYAAMYNFFYAVKHLLEKKLILTLKIMPCFSELLEIMI